MIGKKYNQKNGNSSGASLLVLISSGGAVSGKPFVVSAPHLIFRDVIVRGFWLTSWIQKAKPDIVRSMYVELAEMVAAGDIRSNVLSTYPLENFKEAIVAANSGKGKVLFRMA